MNAKPQKFFGLMIAGMAFVLATGRCVAEEAHLTPVLTKFANTTLSGYIDTTASWKLGTGNPSFVVPETKPDTSFIETTPDFGPSSITPVPEPSTVALLAGGTTVLGLVVRRKRLR